MVVWYNKRKSVYYTPPARNLSRVRIFLTLFGNAHAQLYQNPSDLWYNIYSKPCFASLWALPYRADARTVLLTASQKCPCKQAFLHRGIIKPQKKLRGL